VNLIETATLKETGAEYGRVDSNDFQWTTKTPKSLLPILCNSIVSDYCSGNKQERIGTILSRATLEAPVATH
jgi:hypothetical protein